MSSYDYMMVSHYTKDGVPVIRTTTYQKLIWALNIENEEVMGRPLSDGGAPQAQMVAELLKKKLKLDRVDVYYQGNLILTTSSEKEVKDL